MAKIGTVYLVGAGPGNPELLTVRANYLISAAEIIVYDRLVSDEILALAPKSAEMIYVGKNSGDHIIPQEQINQILADKALAGFDVVRVQGGDCFMFGRGGEELEILHKNHVPFEMVPGITSAFAAPIYAGIPITHRKFCSSVHVVTGHKQKNGELSFDFDSLVKMGGTIIFLMSVATVKTVSGGLISSGMRPDMPASIIENGTRVNQRSFLTTVGELERTVREQSVVSPSTIIVGEVCAFHEDYNWFESLPLFGKNILVTRHGFLEHLLRQLGANVSCVSTIKTENIAFDIPDFNKYSCFVFTSAAGVRAFFARLASAKIDFGVMFGKKLAAVGDATAKTLEDFGFFSPFLPKFASSENLGAEMVAQKFVTKSDNLLLVRAKNADAGLDEELAKATIPNTCLCAYETLELPIEIHGNFDFVTFTSASCVESFAKSSAFSKSCTAVCIGTRTAEKAAFYGMKTITATIPFIPAMPQVIIDEISGGKSHD